MYIAMATANLFYIPFAKALNMIKESGFEYVELDGYWHGGNNWETAQHIKNWKPKDVIHMVLDHGLKIAAFHDMGGVFEDGAETILSPGTYDYMDEYDFPCFIVHTPCIRNEYAGRWADYKKSAIADLQSIAKSKIVCVENMKDFEDYFVPVLSPIELLEFANEAGLSVTIDTTHLAQCNVDIASAASILKDRVKTIHLSDYHCGQSHVFVGDGDLDFKGFYNELNLDQLHLTTIECNIPYASDNEALAIEKCRQVKEMTERLVTGL